MLSFCSLSSAILLCGRWKTGDELPPSQFPRAEIVTRPQSPTTSTKWRRAQLYIEGLLSTSTTHLQSTENSENVLENKAAHRRRQDAKQPGNTEKRTED